LTGSGFDFEFLFGFELHGDVAAVDRRFAEQLESGESFEFAFFDSVSPVRLWPPRFPSPAWHPSGTVLTVHASSSV
jgi:hypothetical protein